MNEDPNEKMIRALKGEIDELKRKLAMGGAGAGAGVRCVVRCVHAAALIVGSTLITRHLTVGH